MGACSRPLPAPPATPRAPQPRTTHFHSHTDGLDKPMELEESPLFRLTSDGTLLDELLKTLRRVLACLLACLLVRPRAGGTVLLALPAAARRLVRPGCPPPALSARGAPSSSGPREQ